MGWGDGEKGGGWWCPSMLCRTSLHEKGKEEGRQRGHSPGSNVNCNCEECDGTDPHCLLREPRLFPVFNSAQAPELMTGQR